MRTFVTFIVFSYTLAILMFFRILSIIIVTITAGIVTMPISKILIILVFLVLSMPTYYFMLHPETQFTNRYIALAICMLCKAGAIIAFCYPVSSFKQGPFFGLLGVVAILWLAIGFLMVKRYCFLVQRGWTEKEKVARSRAARRYQL